MLSGMKFARWVVCCVLMCGPVAAVAGSPVPVDIQRLKGRIVFLWGMEPGDELSFDAQGKLIGSDRPGAFAYSAIKIEKAHQSGAELQIQGKRCGLYFDTESQSPSLSEIRFVPLKEPVTITIAMDPAHPETLGPAIEKVFALSPESILADTPPGEETADLDTLGTTAPIPNPKEYVVSRGLEQHVYKDGTGVSPPKLIHSVAPVYPNSMRASHPGGICVVSVVVDTDGRPTHARVIYAVSPVAIHPVLDREAITAMSESVIVAISQYRFEPGTYNGKPVSVLINVVVNFRIY
jgi:Gram-negative bacterial TonB protein C-terminal